MIEALLAARASPEIANDNGETPLQMARRLKSDLGVRLLEPAAQGGGGAPLETVSKPYELFFCLIKGSFQLCDS